MALHNQRKSKRQLASGQAHRPHNATLISALLATLPPLILAIAKLLETGHALGWW